MKKLLEVCVDSLASARAAQAGGADRLEFCSALAVGGLSPYPELLRQIKAECSLPVRCLMRPRALYKGRDRPAVRPDPHLAGYWGRRLRHRCADPRWHAGQARHGPIAGCLRG